MGFPRQEYWSRLSFPSPNLPNSGIKSGSSVFPALVCILSHFHGISLCETLWTVTCQTPLSMGFSKQEYWSGLPCPPPGDLPNPGIKPAFLMSPALTCRPILYCWKKERKKEKWLSCVWLFVTPWTVAYQAPQSMEFSRQEYFTAEPLRYSIILSVSYLSDGEDTLFVFEKVIFSDFAWWYVIGLSCL